MIGLVYLSRSCCNSAHSSLSLSDSSELAVETVRLRDWQAAGLLACPSQRLALALRPAPPSPSPSRTAHSRCSRLPWKPGAVRTLPSDALLLSELSDWLAVRGGGEWAVGVAWQRGRGGGGGAGEGVTWKRPTVKMGVSFFAAEKKERV